MNLSPATLNALAKFFAIEARKADLAEGEHSVNETITLDVTAIVKKFADEQYTPTASIPLKPVLALLLQRMGVQRDAAVALITEVMTAAINLDADGSDLLLEQYNIDEVMQRVQDMAAALPPKTRKGKTTVKGGFEVTADEHDLEPVAA